MKVVQVIGDLRVGGAERLFVDLVNALDCEQKSIVLLNSADVSPNLMACLNPEIDIHKVRIRKRTLLVDILQLARVLRRLECDVLHSHMFWTNLYCSLAGVVAGTPVVVTSEHGRNEWKRRRHRWIERRVISPLTKYRLCVSQDILERRRNVDGIPESKLVLVPNGTRIPRISNKNLNGPPIIGSVGRLVEAKDLVTLIRAIALLRARGYGAMLRIVGDGPEKARIQEEIDRLDLTGAVHLLGFKSDVGSFLKECTVFASSSIREGQPIALLEAMAHGLPCVATRVGGIPDTMENDVEGIVVPPCQPDLMADALQRLLDKPDLRLALGESARARVIREFSIDALAEKCLAIYESALGDQGRVAHS